MKKLCCILVFAALLLICSGALADIITFPANLTVIEDEAFRGDESVTEVIFPQGLQSIGAYAFANTGLTEVTIPDTVTSI